jgi:glucosamine--fructose-6-phosphate aminotransferase (isomerizing)
MPEQHAPMWEQIYSLPEMVAQCLTPFLEVARDVLTPDLCASLAQVYTVGSGDSHMAGVAAELAFHTLAGLPTRATTALHFARYTVPFLPEAQHRIRERGGRTLVIGISVSGEVARTVEAVRLAGQAGAITAAVTGALQSRLALSVEHILQTAILPMPSPMRAPGVRSYMAGLLMLYCTAIRIGEVRGHLGAMDAAAAREELRQAPEAIAATLRANDEVAERLVAAWPDAQGFVFVGGGPNYGSAQFSAAKLLEASGDAALGQETEEWAHLQYFAREVATPTFILDPGGRSYSRACEVATAARAIGRRVAAVVPHDEATLSAQADAVLPVHGQLREAFSPVLYSLPGMLFANYRAEALHESYYRGFGGGRSIREGGGASRVQTSDIQEELWRPQRGGTEYL